MRDWIKPLVLALAVASLSAPALAHRADPISRAERAGRWLQLDQTQVQQLAHFLTDVQLQRHERAQTLRPELLAVLNTAQKARLAELMVGRQLQLPRGAEQSEARLQRLQQALELSAAQVAELRSRGEQMRAQNEQLREQRRAELVAIVGAENARKIEAKMAQRRSSRQAD